jgi:hypothetical protein
MKTYRVGILAVAILVVVTGIGFGIAQAGGTHSDRPVLSFEDQEALEQSSSSSLYVLVLPSAIDLDYGANGNPSSDVSQASGPIETGAIPATGSEESWMKGYGHD